MKIKECKKNHATKASEVKTSEAQHTKLPKLIITKFKGSHTDWLPFWNIFEAEIDKCSDLKDLVEPKVRGSFELMNILYFTRPHKHFALNFLSCLNKGYDDEEGYERAKNVIISKYGKISEVVNAYVQNIMALPITSGTNPGKIHQFYEKLLFSVRALKTLGKLKDVNGYVRMSIEKLEGIRGDLVTTDDD